VPRCSNDVGETEQHVSTSIRGTQWVTSATAAGWLAIAESSQAEDVCSPPLA